MCCLFLCKHFKPHKPIEHNNYLYITHTKKKPSDGTSKLTVASFGYRSAATNEVWRLVSGLLSVWDVMASTTLGRIANDFGRVSHLAVGPTTKKNIRKTQVLV